MGDLVKRWLWILLPILLIGGVSAAYVNNEEDLTPFEFIEKNILMQDIESDVIKEADIKKEPVKEIITSHTFADGSIGSENFNVTYENGKIVTQYLDKYIELIPYTENELSVKSTISLSSENLPIIKLDKVSYEYNITTDIAKETKYLGFDINVSKGLISKVEDGEIKIGDEDTFEIRFAGFQDIIDKGMNYTLSDKEIKIDLKGKESIDIDPTVIFSTSQINAIDIAPLDDNTFVLVWGDGVPDDLFFQIFDTNGTNITEVINADPNAGNPFPETYSVTAHNSTHFTIGYNKGGTHTAKLCDSDGNVIKTFTVDSAQGNDAIDVSAFNDTHIVAGYMDDADNHASFEICNMNAGTCGSQVDVDTTIYDGRYMSYHVSVSAFNETTFVYLWSEKLGSDTNFAIYTQTTQKVGLTKVNGDFSINFPKLAVEALNETYFVIIQSDTNYFMRYAIYEQGTERKASTVFYANGVGGAYASGIAILNESLFVVGGTDNGGTDPHIWQIWDTQDNSIYNYSYDTNWGTNIASSRVVILSI